MEDALHATRAAVEEGIVPGGGVALIRAQKALDKLTLTGDVAVDDGRNNHFYSDEGEIDTDSGDVVGKTHAHGNGPTGTIEGDAYALSDKGDHATFTGRVKSVLYNHKGPPTPAAQPGAKLP